MTRFFWPAALALCVLGCAPATPPDDSLATYFDGLIGFLRETAGN